MRVRISARMRSTPRIDVRRISWVDEIASGMAERFHSRAEKESGKSGDLPPWISLFGVLRDKWIPSGWKVVAEGGFEPPTKGL